MGPKCFRFYGSGCDPFAWVFLTYKAVAVHRLFKPVLLPESAKFYSDFRGRARLRACLAPYMLRDTVVSVADFLLGKPVCFVATLPLCAALDICTGVSDILSCAAFNRASKKTNFRTPGAESVPEMDSVH